MSMLICQDCGKAFLRKSKKGMAPKRCDECNEKLRLETARESSRKRRALRERVKAKQKSYQPPSIPCGDKQKLPLIPRMKTCEDCGEKKPTSEFEGSTDGRRVRCCMACKEKRLQKKMQKTCSHCHEKKPKDCFELVGDVLSRICKACRADMEAAKRLTVAEREADEAFIQSIMQRHERTRKTLPLAKREKRMTERARKARELGMDYGSYMAMLYREGKIKG